MKRLFVRLAAAVALALLVATGALLAVLPGAREERAHSALARGPDGLRVLFLLCERLGFPARTWSAAPGALPGPGSLLVLAAAPPEPPPGPPASDGTAPARSRDRAHYRRFVDEGGRLLVLGAGADELAALREAGLDLGALAPADAETAEPLALAGETLAIGARHGFEDLPGDARVLARDARGLPVVVVVGAGAIALAGVGADAFTNADLGDDAAPAVLFVRLLEALGPVERVLFDEYALGGWRPASVPALAFGPDLAWPSAHVLLLLVLVLLRAGAAGPFPRDPEPLLAGSPLARARGLARTLERAGRHGLLGRLLARGHLERWCARAGLAPPPSSPRAEPEPAALDARLRELARGDARLHARLAAAVGAAPADDDGLARLGRELAALDARLFRDGGLGAERKSGRALGAARRGSGSSAAP